MGRRIYWVVLLAATLGCGASSGKMGLLNSSSARVPPPATKSYGTADNSYLKSSMNGTSSPLASPTSLFDQDPPPNNQPSVPRELSGSAARTNDELAWLPRRGAVSNDGRLASSVGPSPVSRASYESEKSGMNSRPFSTEPPVKISEPSRVPLAKGTRPSMEITDLPRATSPPRVRISDSTANVGPAPMTTNTTSADSSSSLQWRTRR